MHYKNTLQGRITRTHYEDALQGRITRTHYKDTLQVHITRTHYRDANLPLTIRKKHETQIAYRTSKLNGNETQSATDETEGVFTIYQILFIIYIYVVHTSFCAINCTRCTAHTPK